MKKFISMLAVSAMLVGCLAGCGNSTASSAAASTPAEETTQAATEAPTQETEAAKSEAPAASAAETEAPAAEATGSSLDTDITVVSREEGSGTRGAFVELMKIEDDDGDHTVDILLKRGLSATIEEWLMSAEYVLAGGNPNVILCERGIRTFEKMIRNNLDISAVPLIKQKSHLPVIIDPSHAAGIAWMVQPLARTAIAAGADGLMIEVHNNPKAALCDGAQSLDPKQFDTLMIDVKRRVAFEEKTLL